MGSLMIAASFLACANVLGFLDQRIKSCAQRTRDRKRKGVRGEAHNDADDAGDDEPRECKCFLKLSSNLISLNAL